MMVRLSKALILILFTFNSLNIYSEAEVQAPVISESQSMQNFENDLMAQSEVADVEAFWSDNLLIISQLKLNLKHLENVEMAVEKGKTKSVLDNSGKYIDYEVSRAKLLTVLAESVSKARENEPSPELRKILNTYFPMAKKEKKSDSDKVGEVWFISKEIKINISQSFIDRLKDLSKKAEGAAQDASNDLDDLIDDLSEKMDEWSDQFARDAERAIDNYDHSQEKEKLQELEKELHELGNNIEAEAQRVKEDLKDTIDEIDEALEPLEAEIKKTANKAARAVREAGRGAKKSVNEALKKTGIKL